MDYKKKVVVAVACVLAIGVALTPQESSAGPVCNQQSALIRPIPLGVSGGNITSTIKLHHARGCFSGTLGSLVEDGSGEYILSNNHVLANVNKAKPGQLIVQPGLVDVGCLKSPGNAVATFSRKVKIKFGGPKNTVDAAIAAVTPGDVSADILNIGDIASSLASPILGSAVQKMGRTTCLTTGKIAALDANVKVNYSDNPKKPKVAKFIDQILVTGNTDTAIFSQAGDSGSLIVTLGVCPQAVGLLFAGSADQKQTIANPISDVLSGLNVSMVGSCTPAVAFDGVQADVLAGDMGMSKEAVQSATAVRDRHEDELMSISGAVGTGIGMSDQPGQPAIELYVEKLTPQAQAAAPKEVEGMPVKIIENGGFVAY